MPGRRTSLPSVKKALAAHVHALLLYVNHGRFQAERRCAAVEYTPHATLACELCEAGEQTYSEVVYDVVGRGRARTAAEVGRWRR